MSASIKHPLPQRLFSHRPFRNGLLLLSGLCIVLGLLIVPVEQSSKNRIITNYEEGLWWAVTTASGVGYGDYVPVTTGGRIIGSMLQIFGVVMFGLLIGIVGITLNKRQEEYYWFRLFERLNQLEERLDGLQKQSTYLVKDRSQSSPQSTHD